MKKFILLLLIIPLLSFGQVEKKSSIILKNNESVILSDLFDFVKHKNTHTKLVKEHTYDLLDEDKFVSFDSIYSINDLGNPNILANFSCIKGLSLALINSQYCFNLYIGSPQNLSSPM